MHKSFPAEKGELKLEELKQNEQIQTPKTKKTDEFHLKQITIIALAIFITFCCCILFFFVIYRYNGFTDFWKKLTYILQPVIIGLVVAYLLNPLMKLIDGKLFSLFKGKMKSEKKAKKISRGLAIAGALLFLVGIIVLLIAAIVPSIIQSIQGIISTLPAEVRSLVDWINDIAKGDSQIADIAEEVITQAGNFFENWMKNTLLPQAEVYISSITSGVITGVKFVINILVGLIISVYVMASQEKFAGQAKKIIYAIFKPVRANVVVETVRKSNEIFGGFISGKILDSAIIGVIAYIVLAIMKMPDTMLVAVIIGVTNIIMNIPIVLICFKYLGKDFFFRSVRCMVLFAIFTDYVLAALPVYQGDRMLATICGGGGGGGGGCADLYAELQHRRPGFYHHGHQIPPPAHAVRQPDLCGSAGGHPCKRAGVP